MKNETPLWKYLLVPFRFIAGAKALMIGLAVMILLALLGCWSDTHFNGVLDIHYGFSQGRGNYKIHFIYQLTSWACIVCMLYLSARIFSKSAIRLIDLAGTLAMARIPLFIPALIGFIPGIHLYEMSGVNPMDVGAVLTIMKDNIFWIFLALAATIPASIWYIALMYNAYSVSANLKGNKGGWTFAVGLIISEVLSLVLIPFIIYKL